MSCNHISFPPRSRIGRRFFQTCFSPLVPYQTQMNLYSQLFFVNMAWFSSHAPNEFFVNRWFWLSKTVWIILCCEWAPKLGALISLRVVVVVCACLCGQSHCLLQTRNSSCFQHSSSSLVIEKNRNSHHCFVAVGKAHSSSSSRISPGSFNQMHVMISIAIRNDRNYFPLEQTTLSTSSYWTILSLVTLKPRLTTKIQSNWMDHTSMI